MLSPFLEGKHSREVSHVLILQRKLEQGKIMLVTQLPYFSWSGEGVREGEKWGEGGGSTETPYRDNKIL